MNLMDKIVVVMVAGVLIGVGINQYMYDKDLDGVSNDKDDFPSNPNEWKDTDNAVSYTHLTLPTILLV